LGKAPSANGVIVQFFLTYWPLIKAYYKKMVHTSIPHGKFPPWCHTYTHSIERGKDRYLGIGDLSAYSMSLILYAKALQLRLQPILSKDISNDQIIFLVM